MNEAEFLKSWPSLASAVCRLVNAVVKEDREVREQIGDVTQRKQEVSPAAREAATSEIENHGARLRTGGCGGQDYGMHVQRAMDAVAEERSHSNVAVRSSDDRGKLWMDRATAAESEVARLTKELEEERKLRFQDWPTLRAELAAAQSALAEEKEARCVLQSQVENADSNLEQAKLSARHLWKQKLESCESALAEKEKELADAKSQARGYLKEQYEIATQARIKNAHERDMALLRVASLVSELSTEREAREKAEKPEINTEERNHYLKFKTAEAERDSLRAELAATQETARKAERERDEMRKNIATYDDEIWRKMYAGVASERDAIQKQNAELAAATEGALDIEMGRWQEAIRNLICGHLPNARIDGGGCDSGDPLDLTRAEVEQGLSFLEDEADTLKARNAEMVKALRKIYAMHYPYHGAVAVAGEALKALNQSPE